MAKHEKDCFYCIQKSNVGCYGCQVLNLPEIDYVFCPLESNVVCRTLTWGAVSYEKFLRKLSETDDLAIISQGITWCPGECGDAKRKLANVAICKKMGLDPKKCLDVNGRER